MLTMQHSKDIKHVPLCESHALLDFCNCLGWIQTFRTCSAAVQDSVASVQAHAVVKSFLSLGCALIARVIKPPIRLEQNGRAEVLLAVPPVRWAGCGAASTEDALVKAIELLAICW